jgi:Arc/MetJ-type ribon-helix-helix transcriptional regulator
MTIRLTKDMEKIVHDAVRAGLYTREEEVIPDLLARLRKSLPENMAPSARKAKQRKPTEAKKSLTRAEFDRHLMAIGLLSQIPDTAADFDDPDDEPITIKGEPLSETVIRERR